LTYEANLLRHWRFESLSVSTSGKFAVKKSLTTVHLRNDDDP
jgi:hypothetical protein